jgi:hypothetical protein
MKMKQLLTIGIIFLFVGVAVAPSINSSVVKASIDNDLVEVTSQACGIQDFGNTTVKLTKQQYQDLKQYLVDFRARLNQTTTREEAVPIFKDAVVELDKYGLLPKGMSVEQVQKLILIGYQNTLHFHYIGERKNSYYNGGDIYENYYCLIAGYTSVTASNGPIACLVAYLGFTIVGLIGFLSGLNPMQLYSVIGLGEVSHELGYGYTVTPAIGWIYTNGVNGIGKWNGSFYGEIKDQHYTIFRLFNLIWFLPAIVGFTGIKIGIPFGNYFYLGNARTVLASNVKPPYQ